MDTLFPKRHVPYPRTGNQHLLAAICLFLLQPLLTQNRGTHISTLSDTVTCSRKILHVQRRLL